MTDLYKADHAESDGRKCPIAGAKQTWTSYHKELELWRLSCTLDGSKIGAHIVTRGFSRNENFKTFIPLLDLPSLGRAGSPADGANPEIQSGFQYLNEKMVELTKEGDPLMKMMRYNHWDRLYRSPHESLSNYLHRWTVVYNQVRLDNVEPISEYHAATKLFLSIGFTDSEVSLVMTRAPGFFHDKDKTTLKIIIDAITNSKIVPALATQAQNSSGNTAHQVGLYTSTNETESYYPYENSEDVYDSYWGTCSFVDFQWDEQIEDYSPVWWSDWCQDYVVESGDCFLAYNQCRWCKGFGHWEDQCKKKKAALQKSSPGKGGYTTSKNQKPKGKSKGKNKNGKTYFQKKPKKSLRKLTTKNQKEKGNRRRERESRRVRVVKDHSTVRLFALPSIRIGRNPLSTTLKPMNNPHPKLILNFQLLGLLLWTALLMWQVRWTRTTIRTARRLHLQLMCALRHLNL